MQTIIETVYAEHGIENIPRATANMAEDEDCGWEGGSWASLFMREGERMGDTYGEVWECYSHLVEHEFLEYDCSVGQRWLYIFNDGSAVEHRTYESEPWLAWNLSGVRYTDIKELSL